MNDTYFGQLLISMPNLIDPFFQKTVILICEFSEKAIMGLIINKPVQNIKVSNILKDPLIINCLTNKKIIDANKNYPFTCIQNGKKLVCGYK